MKQKTNKWRTLAVALAVFSSVAAMGQQTEKKSKEPNWMKELTSRITLNGYAQAGWSYQNPNGVNTNSYNLKRTLLWAKSSTYTQSSTLKPSKNLWGPHSYRSFHVP